MTTKTSPTLARAHAQIKQVVFDPADQEHVKAFDMLINHGKQHPTLRFQLEHPYLDVRAMMQAAVCKAYIKMVTPSANQAA